MAVSQARYLPDSFLNAYWMLLPLPLTETVRIAAPVPVTLRMLSLTEPETEVICALPL